MGDKNISQLMPCRGKHAVKEATVTIFVDEKINLLSDSDLNALRSENREFFNVYNKVKRDNLFLKVEGGEHKVDHEPKEVGYRFELKEDGKPSKVFQAINDDDRQYFAFHDLSYIRWKDFINSYKKFIKGIVKTGPFKVKAFALHFLDEFHWKGDGKIPYNKVFTKDNPILTSKVLNNSENLDFLLTIENEEKLLERIQVSSVDKDNDKLLRVSHNLTEVVSVDEDVTTLIESDGFMDKLEKAHKTNKDLIRDIFVKEIRERIHLDDG